MIDRERVLAILRARFSEASAEQLASAANAIVHLTDGWEDVTAHEPDLGYHSSPRCSRICYLAEQHDAGATFRIFLRR
jgi:hypothetical protein